MRFLKLSVMHLGVGIGVVSSQIGRLLVYFSEKLNKAKREYSTYDKEFDALVRALDHWRHYLIAMEFILQFDHEALKYLQSQQKLQSRYAKWVEYLQTFHFTIKHNVVRWPKAHMHCQEDIVAYKNSNLDMLNGSNYYKIVTKKTRTLECYLKSVITMLKEITIYSRGFCSKEITYVSLVMQEHLAKTKVFLFNMILRRRWWRKYNS